MNSVSNKKVSGVCYSGRSKTNGRTSFFGKRVGIYLKAKQNITIAMAYAIEVWGHGLLPYCKYGKFLIQD